MAGITFPQGVLPNEEALLVNNLIPGAEMLGYGFNIFGPYSFDSAIRPLLALGSPGDWVSPSGQTYSLPANVQVPGGSSSSASSSYFATSTEFSSYFQSSASVTGSYGAFSASFSTTYSTEQQNSESYSWALTEADFIAWQVGIAYSQDIVLDTIAKDPDWANLPSNFDPANTDNVLAFYRFFQKFGTHFVSSVSAGGTLYYYFAVSKSASYSATDISVSASAEYKGLIASTQAEANADWGSCVSGWTDNRQSHAATVPATTGVINWVNPQAGTYDQNGNFAEWKAAVVQNPSRCNFALTPIWALFSGAKWSAIWQAYNAYASNRISVRATPTGAPTIIVNSSAIVPEGGYPPFDLSGGWQFVVLDRKTLGVVFNQCFEFHGFGPDWPDGTNDRIAEALRPFSGSNAYILIAATAKCDDGCSPNAELAGVFQAFGAGAGLQAWLAEPNHACSGAPSVYALIGAGSVAQGVEGFSSSWAASTGQASPVKIDALLLPAGDGFLPVSYQP